MGVGDRGLLITLRVRRSAVVASALLAVAGCSADEWSPASEQKRAAPAARAGAPGWDEARQGSVEDLVARYLVPRASDFVEVARPGPPLPLDEADTLPTWLAFATKPQHAGDFGLCQATVVTVPVNRREDDLDTLETRLVFKVVGDTGPDAAPEWTDAYERRLKSQCERAGPVLGTWHDHFTGERFFDAEISPSHHVRYATQALQIAIREARHDPGSVSCGAFGSDCENPAHDVAQLEMARLERLSMAPCGDRVGWQCVKAEFFAGWVVRLEAYVPEMHSAVGVVDVEKVSITQVISLH
jgi:hypothetical protein